MTWHVNPICDRCRAAGKLAIYEPTGPVVDGVEVTTARLACCGSGPDQRDTRTGERLHLPGCTTLGLRAVADARAALGTTS